MTCSLAMSSLGPTKCAFQSSTSCRALPFAMALCCFAVGCGRLGFGGGAGGRARKGSAKQCAPEQQPSGGGTM